MLQNQIIVLYFIKKYFCLILNKIFTLKFFLQFFIKQQLIFKISSSTAFIFNKLSSQRPDSEENEELSRVTALAWNSESGFIAFGTQSGFLKVLMVQTIDNHEFSLQGPAARPSRISLENEIPYHNNTPISGINWDIINTQLTSSDQSGRVIVCRYENHNWVTSLINEAIHYPVVTAEWAIDSSKILILYENGQVLVGASSGHKIASANINTTEQIVFGAISDSRGDYLIIGLQNKIISYNYGMIEKWSYEINQQEYRVLFGKLIIFNKESQQQPLLVVLVKISQTQSQLLIFDSETGSLLKQKILDFEATRFVVSQDKQLIAICGSTTDQVQNVSKALVQIFNFCTLEIHTVLNIPAKQATTVDFDGSGLRLAIGTENSIYLCSLRLSYNQFMLADKTVAYLAPGQEQVGELLRQAYRQNTQQNETSKNRIILFKNQIHKRTINHSDVLMTGCGNYVALVQPVITQNNNYQNGIQSYDASNLSILSSVGSPLLDISLSFYPTMISANSNYIALASATRITLIDLFYVLSDNKQLTEQLDQLGTIIDDNKNYNGIIEWHVDSSPFNQDRELVVGKRSCVSPIINISCTKKYLWIHKRNGSLLGFKLPSLQQDVKLIVSNDVKKLVASDDGTTIATVSVYGTLNIIYTPVINQQQALVQQESSKNQQINLQQIVKKNMQKQDRPQGLAQMLGLDNPDSLEAQQLQQEQNEINTQQAQIRPPWNTNLQYVWNIQYNQSIPELLAVSSKHKIYILNTVTQTFEDPITTSAHLICFDGLQLYGIYLDEMIQTGKVNQESVRIFDTEILQKLKYKLYNKQMENGTEMLFDNVQKPLIMQVGQQNENNQQNKQELPKVNRITEAFNWLNGEEGQKPKHLFAYLAPIALYQKMFQIAQQCYLQCGNLQGYYISQKISQIHSQSLQTSIISLFLNKQNDFFNQTQNSDNLIQLLNELDFSLQLTKLYSSQDQRQQITDEQAKHANKLIGLYQLYIGNSNTSTNYLAESGDKNALLQALYQSEQYDKLSNTPITIADPDALDTATNLLLRLNNPDALTQLLLQTDQPKKAVNCLVSLKRFDKAVEIAQRYDCMNLVSSSLTQYLQQLLTSKDEKAALDLLRKTGQGDTVTQIVVDTAIERLQKVIISPGDFTRCRHLLAFAFKEAILSQRQKIEREIQNGQGVNAVVDKELNDFIEVSDDDSQQKKKKEEKLQDTEVIEQQLQKTAQPSITILLQLLLQSRFLLLCTRALYQQKPEQALWPAIYASLHYKGKKNGNSRILAEKALPIAVIALLQCEFYEQASDLLEDMQSSDLYDKQELEKIAIQVFKERDMDLYRNTQQVSQNSKIKLYQLQCPECSRTLEPFQLQCQCGHEFQLCTKTGQVLRSSQNTQRCKTCNQQCTIGKSLLQACPLCHSSFEQ